MYCVVKLVLVLDLVVAVGSSAAPATEGCEGLTTKLQTKDLHKIYGDWVLVWSVSDNEHGSSLLANLTSSHVNFHLLIPKGKIIVYSEKNVFRDNSCTEYLINLEKPSDSGQHTLLTKTGTVMKYGVLEHYTDSGTVDFYETCPNCLLMVYKGAYGHYLLSYRREGHHSDVEQLRAAHDDHRKQSECLGFKHDEPYIYDGAAAPVCKNCEGVNTRLPTKDLHKIFGDWVLVWSIPDHSKELDPFPDISTSHLELKLLPDKKTVVFNERNVFVDKSCSNYVINLAMPSDPSNAEHLSLHAVSETEEVDGVYQPSNDSAVLDFYETCPDCLLMVYKYIRGRYLLSYRREGHHSDVEQLRAAHDDHRKQSECLGFKHDEPFSYDGAAAVGYDAVPNCKKCQGLNTRLPTKDLHKIFGDWVLVWSVADHQQAWDLLPNLSSSHVELKLLPDQKTVVLNERNSYTDKICSNYVINLAMPSDPSDAEHLSLHAVSATEEVDGVVRLSNDSAVLDFYETCPDCLLMVYKYIHGRYLLSYRREGHHSDAEQLRAAHDDHRKQSECLGFKHDEPFSYDGAAAVGYDAVPNCKKCQGLNTRLPTKDLHKIFGDWVLVWSVADHQQAWDLLPNVSSSHVELKLLPDQKTVVLNERNLYTNKSCSNYVINLAMPSDPSDAEHHSLHTVSATVELDGVVRPYNDSAVLDFYETCPDCLLMVYKYIHGRYLLSYRREGHHSDVEQLRAAHDDHRKQSECLGFKHDKPFSYDGAADFCHKKSSPVKHEQS